MSEQPRSGGIGNGWRGGAPRRHVAAVPAADTRMRASCCQHLSCSHGPCPLWPADRCRRCTEATTARLRHTWRTRMCLTRTPARGRRWMCRVSAPPCKIAQPPTTLQLQRPPFGHGQDMRAQQAPGRRLLLLLAIPTPLSSSSNPPLMLPTLHCTAAGGAANAPAPRAHHTLTLMGHVLVAVGGSGPLGPLPDVHVLESPALTGALAQQHKLVMASAQLVQVCRVGRRHRLGVVAWHGGHALEDTVPTCINQPNP